jgi:hypothetical protein
MREPRLGDDIDDFCVRCKRVMNHNIVSVISGAPAKVRCRTCHSDHDFRNEQPPPPKVDLKKQALFNEVLQKVSPGATAVVGDADADLDLSADVELEPEVAAEAAADAEAPEPEPEPAPVRVQAPKPTKKAKGRPKK